ncbi:MAG TPA: hypothetical protein VFB84_14345 [Micromonosporaceae bacterium]|nr:hypothetical protein [Micromonosporaceae bacterium]
MNATTPVALLIDVSSSAEPSDDHGPLGVAVPEFHKARLSAGDLTDVVPTEYRADAVVTLDVADTPVFAVVVEVQLRADARKRRTWPVYVTTVYARLGCPVVLLVVCPDPYGGRLVCRAGRDR